MPYLQSRAGWWWTLTWNPTGGCQPLTSGCNNCWAAQDAPLQIAAGNPLYVGTTTISKDGRRVFNGTLTHWPRNHPLWRLPQHLKRPASGKPLPIWACATSELFLPGRPKWVLDRTFGRLAASDHIPLILTKLPKQLAAYVNAQPARVQERWKKKFWLGFSAETQGDFNKRWPHMRALAQQGWSVFVSLAPLIGPVHLPDDFLKLAKWVIVSGEEGPHAFLRNMNPRWARAVRDQCAGRIPFFLKQMSHDMPIPPGLDIKEFPEC
jgi:protein gp37